MPSSFTISTNQSTLELDAQRHAEATFTVNNVSGRALRGRAVLKPADKSIESWLKLDGESERNFMIADQQTYKLLIDAPVKAGPGTYPLQFNMVGVAVPEDDLTEGPTVSFKVVAAKPAPNLMPLIIAGVGLMLLAIIAVVIFAVNSGNNAAALAATGTANAGGTVVAQATRDALSAATAAASATNVVLRATQDAQATAGAAGTAAVGTAQAVQKTDRKSVV